MGDWKSQFSSRVLLEGKKLYNRQRVTDMRLYRDAECIQFTANIRELMLYRVSGELYRSGRFEADCTCSGAREGFCCKHMAAVFYAIEARAEAERSEAARRRQEQERKQKLEEAERRLRSGERVYPFRREEANTGLFDLDRMTAGCVIRSDALEEAERLLSVSAETGTVQTLEQGGVPALTVRTTWGSLTADREEIRGLRCSDYRCGGRRGPRDRRLEPNELCPHKLTALLTADRWLRAHPGLDGTNEEGDRMLQAFGLAVKKKAKPTLQVGRTIRLTPRLQHKKKELELSFKTGTDRLYVVKNLTELVEAAERKGLFPLGKNQQLDFSQDHFDDISREYFELIRSSLRNAEHWNDINREQSPYAYLPQMQLKQELPVYGSGWDTLYRLAQREPPEFLDVDSAYSDSVPLQTKEECPRMELTLSPDRDRFGNIYGALLRGRLPELLQGAEASYCFVWDDSSAVMYRLPQEAAQRLLPLSKAAGADGTLNLRFGREHLSEFANRVLPELEKYIAVIRTDMEDAAELLPTPTEFTFYLDAEDGIPACRIGARQSGGEEYTLPETEARPGRNAEAEQEAENIVRDYFPEYSEDEQLFRAGEDDDVIYEILRTGVSTLLDYGEVQSTAAFDALGIRKAGKMQVGVSLQSEILDLKLTSDEIDPDELPAILRSYKRKKRYHRLHNGSFILLDGDLDALAELSDSLQLTDEELKKGAAERPAYRAIYLDRLLKENDSLYSERDAHFRTLLEQMENISEDDFEVPESLKDVLRGYQVKGYQWLRTLAACGFGGILADDMGLGKTLQMIAVLLAAKQEGEKGTSLVVCPASLVYNWIEEFHRFAPELVCMPLAGTKEERAALLQRRDEIDVFVTSYDLLKRDIASYADVTFLYQILDEAQYIKTHTTTAAKSVKSIRSKHRFALTGTPIENRLSELWSIFDYLMPGFLYAYSRFRTDLETPIVKSQDETASERLRQMVAPFILRRLKKEVLKDLPDKLEEIRYARLSGEQEQLYNAQVRELQQLLGAGSESDFNQKKIAILAELTRIRQICCDPSLLFENINGSSAKLDLCMDLIGSAIEGEHRILLFSQFTSMLAILEERLKAENIPYYKLTGETPKEARVELVRQFNEGDTPVFLISLKAGGTGLNLTGADVVIHYDPWWNAAAMNQATDRAHRIGQEKVVAVYKLIAKDTIEEKIQKLQESKSALAEEILSGENLSIGSMTRDELLGLIG